MICPLCESNQTTEYYRDWREYFRCSRCQLVFVPPHYFLSREDEKAEYDLHQNSPADAGYRRFLGRLFAPMSQRLAPASCGLDFGSGPGPTLSIMFEEAGHRMQIYDSIYAPNEDVFSNTFDFISASEVVEHLHYPKRELDRLWNRLRPGGLLGIMTKRVIDQAAFANWHYKNDRTHVVFFCRSTFEWIANRLGGALVVIGDDVVLLKRQKKPRGDESNRRSVQ